jgi:hypothetical protein
MQFSVGDAFNASAEIAASSNYPNLRLATVAMVTANAPRDDAPSKPGTARPVWAPSSPEAINPKGGFSWPSAACYFFGRSLYIEKGGQVPIGLVGSDVGDVSPALDYLLNLYDCQEKTNGMCVSVYLSPSPVTGLSLHLCTVGRAEGGGVLFARRPG